MSSVKNAPANRAMAKRVCHDIATPEIANHVTTATRENRPRHSSKVAYTSSTSFADSVVGRVV